jgi:predicted nucleotidyltransferase
MAEIDEYRQFIIYRCVIGSRAYGLETETSDTDRRGIYLPPAELQWSLDGVPEQIENEASQECYWELEKFLALALKANPHVLECFYTPVVEFATPLARELLAMRSAFLSKRIHGTFNGYAQAQFRKLSQRHRVGEPVKWKMVMHLIRLLLTGKVALEEGDIPVQVNEHRNLLLKIRLGEMSWEEIDPLRLRLHQELDRALAKTSLPEEPNFSAVNAFLVRARRSMVTNS